MELAQEKKDDLDKTISDLQDENKYESNYFICQKIVVRSHLIAVIFAQIMPDSDIIQK